MLRLFKRLFTSSTGSPQAPEGALAHIAGDLDELRRRVHRLEIAREEADAVDASLQTQLRKLRGQRTGGIRHGGEDAESHTDIPFGDKARLREWARQRGLFNIARSRAEGES